MTGEKFAPSLDVLSGLDALFAEPAEEAAYAVTDIQGKLPEWLSGTYYGNGPACFRQGDVNYGHWLDGDGMVVALRIGNGSAQFRSRFVASRKRTEEQQAGRAIYRTFGTRFEGDKLRRNLMLEPPVNVAVLPFAGTLLALGEQSLPIALDPVTLETQGEFDFGGALNEVSPFAAHAKIDPRNDHLVNFGVAYAANRTSLTLYEFDAAGQRVSRRRHALDAPYTIHDFAFTPSLAVFHVGQYRMHLETLLAGGTLQDSLQFDPNRPSELLLLPRDKSGDVQRIRVDDGYCLHLINAFESGETLFVDLILYERPLYAEYRPFPSMFENVSKGRAIRYEVDTADGVVASRTIEGYDLAPDFPAVDPSLIGEPYAEFWCLGMSAAGVRGEKFFDQLVRLSWAGRLADVFTLPAGEYFGGEPAFVAGPLPEEALILVQIFRPHQREARAGFAVFRAQDLAAGPVAELPLQTNILPGFHSSFLPSAGFSHQGASVSA